MHLPHRLPTVFTTLGRGALALVVATAPLVAVAAPLPAGVGLGKRGLSASLLSSNTEVQATANGSPEFQDWRHDLTVAFDDPRPFDFRVKSRAAAAKSIRWELSLRSGFGGSADPKVVHVLDTSTVSLAAGGWTRFVVALGKHAPTPIAGPAAAPILRKALPPAPGGKAPAIAAKPGAAPAVSAWRDTPRVYWLRAVALDGAGRPLGIPSTPVRIVHGPAEHTEAALFPGGFAPPKATPTPGLEVHAVRYEPVQFGTSGSHKRWVVTRCSPAAPSGGFGTASATPSLSMSGPPCTSMPIGKPFEWDPSTPKDKGVVETVGEAIGDAVGFFADAIDWASTAYGDIKKFAVKTAAGMIPLCNSICEKTLSAGLDIGLAAVGLPPSLPDFDAMVDMGEDYLVELITQEVAAAVPGGALTAELAEKGTRALIDETRKRVKEAADHGPKGNRWFKPDPAYLYQDASLLVRVKNTAKSPRHGTLVVRVHGLFETMYIPIPQIDPGQHLMIPLTLVPDFQHFVDKQIRENHGVVGSDTTGDWYAAYQSQIAQIEFAGVNSTKSTTCRANTKCTW